MTHYLLSSADLFLRKQLLTMLQLETRNDTSLAKRRKTEESWNPTWALLCTAPDLPLLQQAGSILKEQQPRIQSEENIDVAPVLSSTTMQANCIHKFTALEGLHGPENLVHFQLW